MNFRVNLSISTDKPATKAVLIEIVLKLYISLENIAILIAKLLLLLWTYTWNDILLL